MPFVHPADLTPLEARVRNVAAAAATSMALVMAGCGGGTTAPGLAGAAASGRFPTATASSLRRLNGSTGPITSFDLGAVCLFSVLVLNQTSADEPEEEANRESGRSGSDGEDQSGGGKQDGEQMQRGEHGSTHGDSRSNTQSGNRTNVQSEGRAHSDGGGADASSGDSANLVLTDDSIINGGAGLDDTNAHLQLHSGTITGSVFLLANTGSSTILNDSTIVLGTIVDPADLILAGKQASAMSIELAALPTTPGMPSKLTTGHDQRNAPLTITAGPGLSVVNLSQLELENTSLTVNAPAGAQVVINVTGDATIENTSLIVTGGLQPGRVAINAVGKSQKVSIDNPERSGTPFGALILAPQRTVTVEGTNVQGIIVGGKVDISEHSSVTQGSSCPSSILPI